MNKKMNTHTKTIIVERVCRNVTQHLFLFCFNFFFDLKTNVKLHSKLNTTLLNERKFCVDLFSRVNFLTFCVDFISQIGYW